MTRYGIGPKFAIVTILCGILTGGLTYRYPGRFTLPGIPYWIWATAATVLLVAGILACIHSVRVFNAGYRKGQLVTGGPYAVVRHPIYAAWILLILPGLVLYCRSWLMLVVPLAAYASFKIFISREEVYLNDRFGPAYAQYRKGTNELVPGGKFWKEFAGACLGKRTKARPEEDHQTKTAPPESAPQTNKER